MRPHHWLSPATSSIWFYSFTYYLNQSQRPSSSSRCAVATNQLIAEFMTFYTDFQHPAKTFYTDFQHPAKITPTWYNNCDSTPMHLLCMIRSIKIWIINLSICLCLVLCQSHTTYKLFAGSMHSYRSHNTNISFDNQKKKLEENNQQDVTIRYDGHLVVVVVVIDKEKINKKVKIYT